MGRSNSFLNSSLLQLFFNLALASRFLLPRTKRNPNISPHHQELTLQLLQAFPGERWLRCSNLGVSGGSRADCRKPETRRFRSSGITEKRLRTLDASGQACCVHVRSRSAAAGRRPRCPRGARSSRIRRCRYAPRRAHGSGRARNFASSASTANHANKINDRPQLPHSLSFPLPPVNLPAPAKP